jgi:hypothetical protein
MKKLILSKVVLPQAIKFGSQWTAEYLRRRREEKLRQAAMACTVNTLPVIVKKKRGSILFSFVMGIAVGATGLFFLKDKVTL